MRLFKPRKPTDALSCAPSHSPAAEKNPKLSDDLTTTEHPLPVNTSLADIAPWTTKELPPSTQQSNSSPTSSSTRTNTTSSTLATIPEGSVQVFKPPPRKHGPQIPERQQPETVRLLVGSQSNTARYLTKRLFEISKTTLYKSSLYTYITQRQPPRRSNTDDRPIPRSLIRLEELDPDAFEFYIEYLCTGTLIYPKPANTPLTVSDLSDASCSPRDLSWAAAWPLLNAHVLATTISDTIFASFVMKMLKSKIDRKQKVDIETIQHIFSGGAISNGIDTGFDDLRRFILDEAIRGGIKNFDPRRMGLYPTQFIHLALQRTMSRLEAANVRHHDKMESKRGAEKDDKSGNNKEREKNGGNVESCEAVARYMRWEAMGKAKEMSTLRVKLVDTARSRESEELRRGLKFHGVWERDFAYTEDTQAEEKEHEELDNTTARDDGKSITPTQFHAESPRATPSQEGTHIPPEDREISGQVEDSIDDIVSKVEGQRQGLEKPNPDMRDKAAGPPQIIIYSPEEDESGVTNISLPQEGIRDVETSGIREKQILRTTETEAVVDTSAEKAPATSEIDPREDQTMSIDGPSSEVDTGSVITPAQEHPKHVPADVTTEGTIDMGTERTLSLNIPGAYPDSVVSERSVAPAPQRPESSVDMGTGNISRDFVWLASVIM